MKQKGKILIENTYSECSDIERKYFDLCDELSEIELTDDNYKELKEIIYSYRFR